MSEISKRITSVRHDWLKTDIEWMATSNNDTSVACVDCGITNYVTKMSDRIFLDFHKGAV